MQTVFICSLQTHKRRNLGEARRRPGIDDLGNLTKAQGPEVATLYEGDITNGHTLPSPERQTERTLKSLVYDKLFIECQKRINLTNMHHQDDLWRNFQGVSTVVTLKQYPVDRYDF